MHEAPNAAQIDAWNLRNGPRWARLQPRIAALFAPVTDLLVAAVAPTPGQRLLDLGCGCGDTLLPLARALGPEGRVLGVDVSAPMLDVARDRVAAEGLGQVQLVLADAATHPFAPAGMDGAMSRFGVMFFDDPVAAFRTIRTALVPGGRLTFACWRPPTENPFFAVPMEAIRALLPPQPPVDPDIPGPFGLARPGRAQTILEAAGWRDVAVEPHDVPIRVGDPGDAEAATGLIVEMVGTIQRLMAEADPAGQVAARAHMAERLRDFESLEGIVLGGAIWLVSARA